MTSGLWLLVDRPVTAPLFIAAIVLSAWLGGLPKAIYTSILSGLIIDYYYIQPYLDFSASTDELIRVGLFVLEGMVVGWLVDKMREMTEHLRQSREQLTELTEYLQTVRENERKRIAMEIHDELGQKLTRIKIDLHFFKNQLINRSEREAVEVIEENTARISEEIDSTIATIRRISTELRPTILDDFGLVAACEWLTKEIQRNTNLKCTFETTQEQIELEAEQRIAVFRIIQEALTNIIRHSKAEHANISIGLDNGNLRAIVEDDGVGIDPEQITNGHSMGVIGMRERARILGGDLTISKIPKGGTQVLLTMPYKKNSLSTAGHQK